MHPRRRGMGWVPRDWDRRGGSNRTRGRGQVRGLESFLEAHAALTQTHSSLAPDRKLSSGHAPADAPPT